jgi:hypothetical protein
MLGCFGVAKYGFLVAGTTATVVACGVDGTAAAGELL